MEVYSTLELKNGLYGWKFIPVKPADNKDIPVDIDIKYTLPSGSILMDKNYNAQTLYQSKKEIKDLNSAEYKIKLPNEIKTVNIYNDKHNLFWLLSKSDLDKKVKISFSDGSFSKDFAFWEILLNTKNNNLTILEKRFSEFDQPKSIEKLFLRYLIEYHDSEILFTYSSYRYDFYYKFFDRYKTFGDRGFYDNFSWEINDSTSEYYNYYTEKILLTSKKKNNVQENIYCGFIDEFIEYSNSLKNDEFYQADKGYLTRETVKLVLENNEKVNRIRKEELYRESNSRRINNSMRGMSGVPIAMEDSEAMFEQDQSEYLHDDQGKIVFNKPAETVDPPPFTGKEKVYAVTDVDQLAREIDSDYLQQNIRKHYPLIAKLKEISGSVTVKFDCSSQGYPTRMKIVKEDPKGLQFGEAAITILKEFRYKPASRYGEPVAVSMEKDINFRINKSANKSAENKDGKFIQYYDRYFSVANIEGIELPFEKGFEISKAVRIKYTSNEHFELLYNNQDIVKYCLDFDNIALIVDGKHYLIMVK